MSRRLALCLFALLALPLSSPLSVRAEVESVRTFERIPILENGRVMPLDSYARTRLLAYSGRSTFDRNPASEWFARVLFTPESTRDDKVFLINNPEVTEALGLPPGEGRERYSYAELEPAMRTLSRLVRAAFQLEQAARSPVENELLRLYHGLIEYGALADILAFTVPHRDFSITDARLKGDLGLPPDQEQFSSLQVLDRTPQLQAVWDQQETIPRDQWNLYQKEAFDLLNSLASWTRGQHDTRLKIIPVPAHGNESWVSPSHVLTMGPGEGPLQAQLRALGDMADAYREGQQVAFDLAAKTFLSTSIERAPDSEAVRHLDLEVRFNQSEAFYRAELLYGLAFLLILFSVMLPARWLYRGALLVVLVALVPHTFGIIARMIIMGRPPVTNLYSTFVFVGWSAAVFGLAIEYLQRNRLGLLTASACGLALLLTAGRFSTESDTMGVMVAVLDSNFWLATHVVTITIGYAGCCVAGLIGHIYLIQALRREPDHAGLKETYDAMYGALAFGLIFSFLGTMLGGVWADQSWGRFWGWDPKENGALVIVLWSAMIFHAKLGRMIGPAGFAGGCVLGVIWVLLAWLGVNLLGVGLHSYGFTSGIARGLLIACTVEVAFVVATLPFAKKPPAIATP